MAIVFFETKCYEADYTRLLDTDLLEKMISRNAFNFNKRILMINNVIDLQKVCNLAEASVQKGIIDEFIVAEHYASEALKFFDLSKDSLGVGYKYSICELVAIYKFNCDFIVHFSGDSILEKTYNWVKPGLDIFAEDRRISVVNPTWNSMYWQAKDESFKSMDNYWVGYGFSDQCYMINSKLFKDKIYNEKNKASERYPIYGGEMFEKRVDSWMRNNNYYRATLKDISYIHSTWGIEISP